MEQHNVYHYHHHHYHYHYTYPFPPGLPPNAPQNNEPLNQEAADHDNDEVLAEDDEEEEEEDGEEEEHSERGDTEDHHNPEDRSPSPVQKDPEFPYLKRSGYVVFDGAFVCLNLDDLSPEALARFTNTQSNDDDYDEGPPRNKARTSSHPEKKKKHQESSHITIIDKARIVSTDSGFRVVNCDPSGPQVDICWRIPGHRNIWLARLGYARAFREKLRTLIQAQAPPEMPLLSYFETTVDEEKTVSLIECSCSDENYDAFESGGGQVVPGDPDSFEFISALGRMVGFEVSQG